MIKPFRTPTTKPGPSANVHSLTASSDLPTVSSVAESVLVPARSSRRVTHRQHAEDADEDEGAFHDPGADEPERERFALPLVDRVRNDRRADVGEDQEQLQERTHQHRVHRTLAADEAGVVQDRVVEQIGRDRGDEK
jgi:hypothetical protein